MSKSTAVEQTAPPQLPALYSPTQEIDRDDVALPRVKIAQGLSAAVSEGLVKLGAIYSSVGKDDPDPVVLAEAGDEAGVIIHVIGLRKGKSLNVDGQLETWAFGDIDAPKEARTTYDYSIALPEHDEEIPYKFLFAGSSSPAARQINTVLVKNEGRGPAYQNAFRITTAKRQNEKGTFFVARVAKVDADPKHVEVAARLASMVSGGTESTVEQSNGDAPAI